MTIDFNSAMVFLRENITYHEIETCSLSGQSVLVVLQ